MHSVWVPILEYPEGAEHPTPLGAFANLSDAMRVAHEKATSILEDNLEWHPNLEVIERNRGYDVDDDANLWCIRVSSVPFSS